MFSLFISARSLPPWPPMPMPARLSFSFGETLPGPPRMRLGTTVNTAMAAARARKPRREMRGPGGRS